MICSFPAAVHVFVVYCNLKIKMGKDDNGVRGICTSL